VHDRVSPESDGARPGGPIELSDRTKCDGTVGMMLHIHSIKRVCETRSGNGRSKSRPGVSVYNAYRGVCLPRALVNVELFSLGGSSIAQRVIDLDTLHCVLSAIERC